ncbi:MAG: VanW family protein [Candidatus Limivicinus sp.]
MKINKKKNKKGYQSRHSAPESGEKFYEEPDDFSPEPDMDFLNDVPEADILTETLPDIDDENDMYAEALPEEDAPAPSAEDELSYEDDFPDEEDIPYGEELPIERSGKGKKGRKAKKEKKPAPSNRESRRTVKITLGIVLAIVLLAAAAVTVGGYMVTNNGKNLPNAYVDGVFVGGMNRDETMAALKKSSWDETSGIALQLKLMDKVTVDIDQCLSGARFTMDEAADAAYAYGHGSNIYENLMEYLKSLIVPVDVNDISLVIDNDYIRTQAETAVKKLNEELGDGAYTIDKEKSLMRMIKGAGQLKFDLDAMGAEIVRSLKADETELVYSQLSKEPKMPDFEAIHEELKAEPRDAYFTDDNTFNVVDEIVGCDFDVDEAELIWQKTKNADELEIPLKLTFPEITGEKLRGLLYRDKLGTMTTYYKNSVDNRINNINLAASRINDVILYPGDVFSYNETIGQRTEEEGFLPAGAYDNGEVIEERGGGICQVSSTLYSAMLYGYNLTTVARKPHYFPVVYLEKGYDATVSWPEPDFQFRNDRDFPVKIVAYCDNDERSLTVEIWGTNLDGSYIEIKKDTLSYNNDRYPWITEGYGVQVHRMVFDADGMQIDQIDEVYDLYHTHEATEQIKALDAAAAAAGGELPQ